MKIILNKDVDNLGEEGDVCDVARGYARNYLFPKELALAYTKENIARIENRRAAIEKRKEEKRQNALGLKDRLEQKEIVIRMNAGQGGKLFGSVTNAMIAEELQKEGIDIERKRIEVSSHTIKMVGTYPVRIRLYENNEAQLKIRVVNQNEETVETVEVPKEEKVEATPAPAEEVAVEEPVVEEPAAEEAAAEETAEDETVEEESPEADEESAKSEE